MARGRPVKSEIRQNMIEVLFYLGRASGYDIYKVYKAVYPQVTLRSMYHHLKKGVTLGEFKLEKVEKEEGDYSWGSQVEKIYYTLGQKARPVHDMRVKDYLDRRRK